MENDWRSCVTGVVSYCHVSCTSVAGGATGPRQYPARPASVVHIVLHVCIWKKLARSWCSRHHGYGHTGGPCDAQMRPTVHAAKLGKSRGPIRQYIHLHHDVSFLAFSNPIYSIGVEGKTPLDGLTRRWRDGDPAALPLPGLDAGSEARRLSVSIHYFTRRQSARSQVGSHRGFVLIRYFAQVRFNLWSLLLFIF
jgi:hypothetical protein